jgi:membrane-associated phospholipid phosphatase
VPRRRITPVERAELALFDRIAPWLQQPAVEQVAKLGKLGDQPPLLALSTTVMAAGLVTGRRRLARTGARMVLAHLLATAVKTVGKNNLDRTRPHQRIERGEYRLEPGKSEDKALRSFPSGHTAGAVAVAQAVAREYQMHALPARSAAAAIGLFQFARRNHFPTDIAAGIAIGVAAEAAVSRAIDFASDVRARVGSLERAKGFEPSTPTLARSCSTPELRPLGVSGDEAPGVRRGY